MRVCVFTDTSAAATVMTVMCITALVVIMVLGIYRFHAVYLEGLKDKQDEWKEPEIVWDDSTFTITVNPMEVTCTFASLTCPVNSVPGLEADSLGHE